MRKLTPTAIALIAGAAVLLLLVVVLATRNRTNEDRLSDSQLNGTAASDPEKQCASQATYDLIKRELFRRAGQLRGSDQAAFDKLAAYSVVRMDAPMLKSHDEDLGTISCTGSLALDLPPGVAVVGGRRTLSADVGYSLQPAADRTGNVLALTNADAIITPLATLARVGPTAADIPADGGNLINPLPTDPGVFPPEPGTAQPVQPAPTTASPSFDCRAARSRSEIAVCNDGGLAALDRQMAGQFLGAMSRASGDERALLQSTRARFLSFRDSCRSDSCIADAYRGRITEIGDIMAGRWRAQR